MRFIAYLISMTFLLSSCGGDHNKWAVQTVPEGNFSVFMPGPVEKFDKAEATPFGTEKRQFLRWKPSSVAIDKFKLFEVSYIVCPTNIGADSMVLNRVLDSAVNLRKNDFAEPDMIQSEPIEFNGFPGRAFFYDDPKGNTNVSVKICYANGKLYDLTAISKKNYSTNNESSDFFNSFKLLN